MSLKQEQQMSMPSMPESNPSVAPHISSARIETKTPIKTSLVPEEDLDHMRAQIANEFKHSPGLSGKSPEWIPETGKLKQGIALARITNKIFWSGVLKPLFRKSKKEGHS